MLLDLQPNHQQQRELDLEDDCGADSPQLMTVLDGLNQRYGKGTVLMGSAGLDGDRQAWSMNQERRTPGYTTRWVDIPVVRA
jgi:DNA polymerase V